LRALGWDAKLALILIFVFALWANLMTPYWADDYVRMVDAGPIQSIILAWHDYFSWTGRIFVTAATYALMSFSHRWSVIPFDILNAFFFVALTYLITSLAASDRKDRGLPFILGRGFVDYMAVALMLWWLPRSIGEVALWKTGSIGYLWAITGEMFLLERSIASTRRLGHRPAMRTNLAVGAAAFIIATALEPLSLLFSGLLVINALLACKRNRIIAPRVIVIALCHVLGTIVLFSAPGNYARAHTVANVGAIKNLLGWLGFFGELFDPMWLPVILIGALAYFIPSQTTAPAAAPRVSRLAAILRSGKWSFLIISLTYELILLGVPQTLLAPRLAFSATVFLIVYIASVFELRPRNAIGDKSMALVVCALMVPHLFVSIKDIEAIKRVDERWKAALTQEHAGPNTDATVPIIKVRGHMMLSHKDQFFESIEPDQHHWINQAYARIMNLRSVTGIQQSADVKN
jgi:hypothetical protein